jgi:hypothetical protein
MGVSGGHAGLKGAFNHVAGGRGLRGRRGRGPSLQTMTDEPAAWRGPRRAPRVGRPLSRQCDTRWGPRRAQDWRGQGSSPAAARARARAPPLAASAISALGPTARRLRPPKESAVTHRGSKGAMRAPPGRPPSWARPWGAGCSRVGGGWGFGCGERRRAARNLCCAARRGPPLPRNRGGEGGHQESCAGLRCGGVSRAFFSADGAAARRTPGREGAPPRGRRAPRPAAPPRCASGPRRAAFAAAPARGGGAPQRLSSYLSDTGSRPRGGAGAAAPAAPPRRARPHASGRRRRRACSYGPAAGRGAGRGRAAHDMNSWVHWVRVSSGLVTVWPIVCSLVKISKSLPPCGGWWRRGGGGGR